MKDHLKQKKQTTLTVICNKASIVKTPFGTSIKLTCYDRDNNIEEEFIAFFNIKKYTEPNASVGIDSKFAKLFRLATGLNPRRNRYYKAQQLMKKLTSSECNQFIIEFDEGSTMKLHNSFKIKKIKPLNPVYCDKWFLNGELKSA
ncbi:hypothetical protein [Thiomicrorhabdus sp. Milos-T2]|uniref:hypothetical protein n=1 Tax=Thiomicrorhabdus sp. Milos-T2 TaxID=90814 RepID=UPI000493EC0D|nr:hypothetical protein [Thiomicrorhabdus sp. Milos-T2]